ISSLPALQRPVFTGKFVFRGSEPRLGMFSTLSMETADNQGNILPAESEAVTQSMFHALLAGDIRDVVEVTVRIRDLVVDGRRQRSPPERHHCGDQLDSARRGNQVAQHALAAAHRDLVGKIAKDIL